MRFNLSVMMTPIVVIGTITAVDKLRPEAHAEVHAELSHDTAMQLEDELLIEPDQLSGCHRSSVVDTAVLPVVLSPPMNVILIPNSFVRNTGYWRPMLADVERIGRAVIEAVPDTNRAGIHMNINGTPSECSGIPPYGQMLVPLTNNAARLGVVTSIGLCGAQQYEWVIADMTRELTTQSSTFNGHDKVIVFIGKAWEVTQVRGKAIRAADNAKRHGIHIMALCIPGVQDWCQLYRDFVTSPDDYFEYPASSRDDFGPPVDALINRLLGRRIVAASLEHRLSEAINAVAGSVEPAPSAMSADGRRLRWDAVLPLPAEITATYKVAPQVDRYEGTGVTSTLIVTDDIGVGRVVRSATHDIAITGPCTPTPPATPTPSATPTSTPTPTPTATATVTPTATPTATLVPLPVYLPVMLHERCDARQQRVDVAIVIDASTSMGETTRAGRPKLTAAVAAAVAFLDLLDLEGAQGSGNQAAVVSFNSDAMVLAQLTDDRPTLEAALAGITMAQQTRLDRAVAVGADVLADTTRRRVDNLPVLVLLTDGRANPVPVDVAVQEAARAKAAGVMLFTIGLGDDLDAEALARMATEPRLFLQAPDAEDLAGLYGEVARNIPCPASAWWGGR